MRGFGVALVVAALGWLACLCACTRKLELKRGDELYSILEEAVLEVSLRGPDRRVDARRFRSDQPWHYSFESQHDAHFARCGSSPELDAALARLLTIRVRDVLSADQGKALLAAHPSDEWLELAIRSVMPDADPFRLRLMPGAPQGPLRAQLPGDGQVFTVDPAMLQLLSLRCPL